MQVAVGWTEGLRQASIRLFLAYTIVVSVAVGSVFAAIQLEALLHVRPAANEYNLVAWELRHFGNRWLFGIGSWFRDGLSTGQEDALVQRFLVLTSEIDDLERRLSDGEQRGQDPDEAGLADLAARHDERDAIENQVEAIVEARVSAVLASEGIERDVVVQRAVWPPVDFEFTQSPRNLVTSPRDRIELKGTSLLRENLDLGEVERIEDGVEAGQGVSALSFSTGGIGAYPTLVQYTDDYQRLLEVVAHEWVHNYLVFSPLGLNYYGGSQLRAMNETVADLIGHEVAAAAAERWPLEKLPAPEPRVSQGDRPGRPAAGRANLDVRAELRDLRAEVDLLLAEGMIDDAEALMEERRRYLADNGYYIRKLNQAYFAFTNLYAGGAGNPAATNPIGPKIDELRQRSGSLARFVEVMRDVTSVAGLDRALEKAGSGP